MAISLHTRHLLHYGIAFHSIGAGHFLGRKLQRRRSFLPYLTPYLDTPGLSDFKQILALTRVMDECTHSLNDCSTFLNIFEAMVLLDMFLDLSDLQRGIRLALVCRCYCIILEGIHCT